jgi:hypothetical protein
MKSQFYCIDQSKNSVIKWSMMQHK